MSSRSQFLNPLLAIHEPGEWVVAEDIVYSGPAATGALVVPMRFITDLASIPRMARSFIPVNGSHRVAAIFHDYAYCRPEAFGFTDRKQADQLFYDLMIETGVHPATAKVMYLAVRSGGWLYWNKRRDDKEIRDFVDQDYFGG